MGIKELTEPDIITPYKRPRFGTAEAEQAWKERQVKRRETQTVRDAVAEDCLIETVRGTTLRDGEEAVAAAVGGPANLDRLARVGAVNMISENQLKTNQGEYELITKRPFTHGGKIYDQGEGFNASDLDRPAEDPYQAIGPDGRIVTRQGRPAVDGAELAESLIAREVAARAELRRRVVQRAKEILKGSGGGTTKGKAE